LGPWL